MKKRLHSFNYTHSLRDYIYIHIYSSHLLACHVALSLTTLYIHAKPSASVFWSLESVLLYFGLPVIFCLMDYSFCFCLLCSRSALFDHCLLFNTVFSVCVLERFSAQCLSPSVMSFMTERDFPEKEQFKEIIEYCHDNRFNFWPHLYIVICKVLF